MSKTFKLDIRTPEGIAWQGNAEVVTLPGKMGAFQVLVNHAPLLGELDLGEVRIAGEDGSDLLFASSGGFAEVRLNEVTVLSETIEPVDVIDVARAEAARDRATERLHTARIDPAAGIDKKRAEAALARAVNRLKVASRA